MNLTPIAYASLRYHRRTSAGVMLGFAIASAVLVGALLVGNSLRGTLKSHAEARIGGVRSLIAAEDRAFRAELATELAARLDGSIVAPALLLPGHASASGGKSRTNDLWVLGVDDRFFELSPKGESVPLAALSDLVAEKLGVEAGDEILLRVEAPSALPREMILAPTEDSTLGLRVKIERVLGTEDFARFGLNAGPLPPGNVFVPREWLASELGLTDVANVIVSDAEAAELQVALEASWQLEDVQLEVSRVGDETRLTSPRVFLDPPVEEAIRGLGRPALGVLTYFVNSIDSDQNSTPYSMVAALGDLGPPGLTPDWVSANGITFHQWTADDHAEREGAAPLGIEVDLHWWKPGPDRKLTEDQRTFEVARVIPMEGLAADPDLMPAFPGLEGEEHCRDWEPGVALDLSAIRDEDETYWEEFGGTPKAFLSLAVGQELWSNRFGTLTSVRAPDASGTFATELRSALTPGQFGLSVRDVAAAAEMATSTPTDFGGLFMSLSFFLMVAAMLLAALLFGFGVEQRASEIGAFRAMGWASAQVRSLFQFEAAVLAMIGASIGALFGALYTQALLAGLASTWSGAVAALPIEFHWGFGSIAGGVFFAAAFGLMSAHLALKFLEKRSVLSLLGSSPGVSEPGVGKPKLRATLRAVGLLGGLALIFAPAEGASAEAGKFFGAGALFLIGGLAHARQVLEVQQATSFGALAKSNAARRPGRSLATMALLASGTFLTVSIGVHRKGDLENPRDPASGTGGFALIGQSTLPVSVRLDTPEGLDAFGLEEGELEGVTFTGVRVREGDDASCLNLGAPSEPQLLGVDARSLEGRFTFAEGSWSDLLQPIDGAIPAIGDAASIKWTMKRAVGDEYVYTDGRGQEMRVRIVGAVTDSILQGSLIIDEQLFREHFPGDRGPRQFWIDAPAETEQEVSERLTFAMQETGLALEPAADRLRAFRAVQNTYLDIFQVLGGLGVLLGSVGVAIVSMRNAVERRRELAALLAVGYSRRDLHRYLWIEHARLLAWGLGIGVLASAASLVPAGGASRATLFLLTGTVLVSIVSVVLATAASVRAIGVTDRR